MVKEELTAFLTREHDIGMAVLYGSFAKGLERPDSDVDIAVWKDKPLDLENLLDLANRIRQLVQREVDLVDLSKVHGALLSEILTGGTIILLRDPVIYEQLLKRMWYEREDDGRFIEKILQERLRSWEK